MSNKSQTVFAVCFGLFLAVVVTVSLLFADKLAQKAEAKNEVGILMEQAALAFPIVVFVHKLANNARKVMEITECVVHDNGELEYRVLYRYKIKRNLYHGGRFTIEGEFVKENTMSEDLREKLLRGGVPGPLLERFMGKEMIA